MVFMNSANLPQNQQNAASGCPRTLKMEAFGTQNGTSGQQNEPPELQIEVQDRSTGPSERQNGCPAGPWWPNLLLSMLLTAVFDASGNLRECFWWAPGPHFGGFDVHGTASFPASGLQSASAGFAKRKQSAVIRLRMYRRVESPELKSILDPG